MRKFGNNFFWVGKKKNPTKKIFSIQRVFIILKFSLLGKEKKVSCKKVSVQVVYLHKFALGWKIFGIKKWGRVSSMAGGGVPPSSPKIKCFFVHFEKVFIWKTFENHYRFWWSLDIKPRSSRVIYLLFEGHTPQKPFLRAFGAKKLSKICKTILTSQFN